jgi:hypothetical protein
MKKLLLAAILLISGIIVSCSRQQSQEKVIAQASQVAFTNDMKNIASAD